jgi:hypothetical protein
MATNGTSSNPQCWIERNGFSKKNGMLKNQLARPGRKMALIKEQNFISNP